MICVLVVDFFVKSSGGRKWKFLRKIFGSFWKFLFFPKTAPLKGKEKKLKEKETSGARQFLTYVPVDKSGFAEKKGGWRWT